MADVQVSQLVVEVVVKSPNYARVSQLVVEVVVDPDGTPWPPDEPRASVTIYRT